jgi:hypothetical protein
MSQPGVGSFWAKRRALRPNDRSPNNTLERIENLPR